jgi:hypothetical protein
MREGFFMVQVKSQKSKVKSQKSKVKSRKSKVKSQKSKVKSQKSKVESQNYAVQIKKGKRNLSPFCPDSYRDGILNFYFKENTTVTSYLNLILLNSG